MAIFDQSLSPSGRSFGGTDSEKCATALLSVGRRDLNLAICTAADLGVGHDKLLDIEVEPGLFAMYS